MKALSLWQPWATLVAIGAKRIETRSWSTPYRGPLLIHASKKWNSALNSLCVDRPFQVALRNGGITPSSKTPFKWHLPLGELLAVVDLYDCVETDPALYQYGHVDGDDTAVQIPPPEPERSFGDYRAGRFAWLLRDLRPLPKPIPWKGRQSLFEVPITTLLPEPPD